MLNPFPNKFLISLSNTFTSETPMNFYTIFNTFDLTLPMPLIFLSLYQKLFLLTL